MSVAIIIADPAANRLAVYTYSYMFTTTLKTYNIMYNHYVGTVQTSVQYTDPTELRCK